VNNGAAIVAGWAADQVFGEPPTSIHPVAAFRRLMARVERATYRPSRLAGVAHLAVGVALATSVGLAAQRLLGRRAAVAVSVTVSVAAKMLADEARAVLAMVEAGDLGSARDRVRSLVGRNPDDLDADGIVRAVIESVAENTVDAVIAPLCWAALAGAPAVLAHRAVNTLDAMVGHRSERYERFGWASARLDDVGNYVPARVAALAVLILAPHRAPAIVRTVRDHAPAHPSPNGGVIEAAVAAALSVRLGGTNRYGTRIEQRGVLGDGRTPSVADGRRSVKLTTAAGALVAASIACNGAILRHLHCRYVHRCCLGLGELT
jgi:adenosylcobinamide-phosphate synthase